MIKLKFFLKSIIGISLFSVILFLAAGKISFVQGWIYYGLSIFGLSINIFLMRKNEELMKERSTAAKNTKDWDKKILGLSAFFTLVTYGVAGLDAGRFHFMKTLHFEYIIMGSILTVIGQILFAVAKSQNNYFSSVARIQTERNHTVCDVGLYKLVRHPGYLGMIISWIGFPFIFGSMWCVLPTLISVFLLIVRTSLEDAMLCNELYGYKVYSKKIRYKLIPYIW